MSKIKEPEDRPFRALSIDGGGMRGLYTATFLDELARLFGDYRKVGYLDVGKGFDLIAGTSTGGIIACGLAAGRRPSRIKQLYRKQGSVIFSNPIPEKRQGLVRWGLSAWKRAANRQAPLRTELEKLFGTTTLAELYHERGIALCLPAVNMANHSSRVFKTPHLPRLTLDLKRTVVDACLATSAAPIVLPLAALSEPDDPKHTMAFADGGLWANNPILVAIVEALQLVKPDQSIEILSLSTSAPPTGQDIRPADANWGIAQWKVGLAALETALDSQSSGYNFIAELLAPHLKCACQILRYPASPPSPQDARFIGLDQASDKANSILVSLGSQDARMAYGEATREKPSATGEFLRAIFETMPTAKAPSP
jgi:predicted acylesterase/phospholipase RssA